MSSIPYNTSTGMLPHHFQGNSSSKAAFASHTRNVNAYEQLDADLTIRTREGDVVTLSSSSLAQYSDFSYSSKGVIKNNTGKLMAGQQMREITLATGESFSFSVQGDLNEEELADIESIIKGIDSIISEVTQGDMDEAIKKALEMEHYDSVSMYNADIVYARGVSISEETKTASAISGDYVQDRPGLSNRRAQSPMNRENQILERMLEQLKEQEELKLKNAQQPLESLFRHHLDKLEDDDKKDTPVYAFLQDTGKSLDQMMTDMLKDAFGERLARMV